jgi:molybdopterin-binding protein
MKKLFLMLIAIVLFGTIGYSQVVCPTPVTQFTFTISRPVVLNQKVGGASVCDPDVGQTAVWSIVETQTLWKMNTNGDILVADATAVNNSALTTFSLTIKVTDNGTPVLASTAGVTINDTNSPPVIAPQTFAVNENMPNGTLVGTVVATDPNTSQTKTYSIVSGNVNSTFSINATTGAIVVTNVAALNFEATPTYAIVIKVQDNGTPSLSAQATMTINVNNVNEAPVIIAQ